MAFRQEPGRNSVQAARDSEGSALPKVQKSSVPTPSLTTSQPPRGPGMEPHPGQTPSLRRLQVFKDDQRPSSFPKPTSQAKPGELFSPKKGVRLNLETCGKGRVWERGRRKTWSLLAQSLLWLCVYHDHTLTDSERSHLRVPPRSPMMLGRMAGPLSGCGIAGKRGAGS